MYDINCCYPPKREPTTYERICLEKLNIAVQTVAGRKGRWLSWSKPEHHELKLNVDGSCKGHMSAGGGLVRDRNGDFLFGFSAPYDHDDALGAELQSLLDGMRMCKEQRKSRICIEVDAAMVINMLKNKAEVHWKYEYLIRRIKSFISSLDRVSLICREQNMASDKLAKSAIGGSDSFR